MTGIRIWLIAWLFSLFMSSAWAQTPLCSLFESLDPVGEIEASPRENAHSELLSLGPSFGVAADSQLYASVERDLDWIASVRPDVAEIPILLDHSPGGIFVEFLDPASRDVAQNGELPDFECLNELFELDYASWYSGLSKVVFLSFEGRYKIDKVGEAYEQVPGVVATFENSCFGPCPSACLYRGRQGRRVYFFEKWGGWYPDFFPERLVRAEILGTGGQFVETTAPYDPPLAEEYEACKEGLLNVRTVVEIPTLSSLAASLLAALLAITACRWFSRRRRSAS